AGPARRGPSHAPARPDQGHRRPGRRAGARRGGRVHMSWIYTWWIELARILGLPEAFQYPFVARGVVAILLLAPLLGGLSHLGVARRLAFFSTTVGQAALTGLVIGVAVGQPLDDTYPAILGFCLMVGVVMAYVRRQTRLPPDTVIGVFMAFTLGLGICLLVAATRP